jgi:hypothetical protein
MWYNPAMIALNGRYDGKVIVPDAPLDLPADQKVRITVEPIATAAGPAALTPAGKIQLGLQRGVVLYVADDFDGPLPDELWGFNQSADDNGDKGERGQ